MQSLTTALFRKATIAICAIVLGLGSQAAVAARISYMVFHDQNQIFNVKPGSAYQFRWRGNVLTYADERFNAPDFETDTQTIGPIFPPFANQALADAQSGATLADGKSMVEVAGTLLAPNSTHGVEGFIDVNGNTNRAVSAATSGYRWQVGTVNARGTIRWRPRWHIDSISATRTRLRDPIIMNVLSLDDNEFTRDAVFAICADLEGEGYADWDQGRLEISANQGSFGLFLDSPYIVSDRGIVDMEYESGIITKSQTTGAFSGLFPAVGDPVQFTVDLQAAGIVTPDGFLDILVDYGAANQNGYEIAADLSATGSVIYIPEPLPLMMAVVMMGTVFHFLRDER